MFEGDCKDILAFGERRATVASPLALRRGRPPYDQGMPQLLGTHITLREYRHDDFSSIRSWINDPEVAGHLSPIFDPPQTEPMTTAFLEKVLNNELPGYFFIIASREEDRYIGQVDLRLPKGRDPSLQGGLAIVIPKVEDRGKGCGSEALSLLLDFAFDRINLHKVWLEVFPWNAPAIALYEKLGFQRDGVLRDDVFRDGEYHDMYLMTILAAEWRGRRDSR